MPDLSVSRVLSRTVRVYYEMLDGSIQTENPYPAMLRERGIILPE